MERTTYLVVRSKQLAPPQGKANKGEVLAKKICHVTTPGALRCSAPGLLCSTHTSRSASKASGLTAWRLHVFGENAAGQHIAACPAEKTVNNNLLLQVKILKGTIFLLRRRYALREPPFCLFISQMWFFDCFFGGLRHGAQKRLTKNLQDH